MACSNAWCRSETVHWYLCRCFLSHLACRSRRKAALVVAERAIICRMVHLFFSRQRRGPTGEVGGSGGHLAAAISRHQETCVYWILEQVYHHSRTLSSISYSVFEGWFSLGCWWGSPRRSRALCSGPTITGGRSRSPSDSRRGLVPVAPPAPRPRREGRACAPRSSDIICNPPSALATDDTPRRGSRARSLHGPRHTSPIAAPPL